jgi:hypothetical protein
MPLFARIIGMSLVPAALGVALGFAFFGGGRDCIGICLFLASVGGIIGAIAASAQEIVTALRQKPSL